MSSFLSGMFIHISLRQFKIILRYATKGDDLYMTPNYVRWWVPFLELCGVWKVFFLFELPTVTLWPGVVASGWFPRVGQIDLFENDYYWIEILKR